MGMDSYLEMFTTLYGWSFAATIYGVLSSTGLVVLPFLFMFISAALEAHERGMENGGVTWLVRKLEIQVFTAIFVFVSCVAPMSITSLDKLSLYHTPTATAIAPSPPTVTGADTGTTYDGVFADAPGVAAVPPWWYTVMHLSSGLNAAVRAGVTSGVRDFRMLQDIAHSATIADPKLRDEVQRFNSECFIPARSRYLRMHAPTPAIEAALAEHGPADPDWMGSHAFRDEPTLYPSIISQSRLPQFLFDPGIEPDIGPEEPIPVGGRRSCDAWWAAPDVGLRAKLVDEVGNWQSLKTKLGSAVTFTSSEQEDDVMARLGMRAAKPSYVDPEGALGNERDLGTAIGQTLTYNLGGVGVAKEAFVASASMTPMIQMMTMAQPLILMGLYMFLPLVTVLSGYSLQVFVTGAVSIFTVKFWSAMWFIARWADDHLIEAMHPDVNSLLQLFLEPGETHKRMVLNILLMMLYIGLPLIWTGMMGWIGYQLSAGIGQMIQGANKGGTSMGRSGAGSALPITSGVGAFLGGVFRGK